MTPQLMPEMRLRPSSHLPRPGGRPRRWCSAGCQRSGEAEMRRINHVLRHLGRKKSWNQLHGHGTEAGRRGYGGMATGLRPPGRRARGKLKRRNEMTMTPEQRHQTEMLRTAMNAFHQQPDSGLMPAFSRPSTRFATRSRRSLSMQTRLVIRRRGRGFAQLSQPTRSCAITAKAPKPNGSRPMPTCRLWSGGRDLARNRRIGYRVMSNTRAILMLRPICTGTQSGLSG